MLRSFPKGRTTEELFVLVGASFSHDKRLATLAELDDLLAAGFVRKIENGKWVVKTFGSREGSTEQTDPNIEGADVIHAAVAT